jgi:hypothetical protein
MFSTPAEDEPSGQGRKGSVGYIIDREVKKYRTSREVRYSLEISTIVL